MPIGSSKLGVLGAGLVPGGSVTFNASGTWPIPPGVKKVSITGKGGTGNPGVAGNAGNPGNPGSGGGGGGGEVLSFPCPGGGTAVTSGGAGGIAFKSAAVNGIFPGPVFNQPNWYSNNTNRNLYGMTIAAGGTQCVSSQNGEAGENGQAGAAGQAGTAGNNGQPSSGLGNTFQGGAGGNAPVGGAAGNGGTAGNGGLRGAQGGTGGNGGGSGGSAVNLPGAIGQNSTNQAFVIVGGGGGGAGTVNDGQAGPSTVKIPAPYNSCNQTPIVANSQFTALGGTDPQVTFNAAADAAGITPPNYNTPVNGCAFKTVGGNGGFPPSFSASPAVFVRTNPFTQGPYNYGRTSINNISPTPLRPTVVRAGGGGGSSGTFVNSQPNNSLSVGGRGGGGGRGNAGNAGGNSPTVSGQAATPSTFNCVPVTPGGTTPITVGTPGGQIVISWNPQ
jgi:hypothetical protein